jgi:hypothetical protein
LDRVDRKRPIKTVVIEGQALHRTVPQVDTTALDTGCVPGARLLNHLPRLINARDGRQLRQVVNNRSGSETQFQNPVVRSDFQEVADPTAAISIRAGHDETWSAMARSIGRAGSSIGGTAAGTSTSIAAGSIAVSPWVPGNSGLT